MDHSTTVKVRHPFNNLTDIILNLQLRNPSPFLHHLVQSIMVTQLQQDIHIFRILKNMIELNDVLVIEYFVNFDLRNQLNSKENLPSAWPWIS